MIDKLKSPLFLALAIAFIFLSYPRVYIAMINLIFILINFIQIFLYSFLSKGY